MNIYIGENIKRLRLEKQITQEQLSVVMGISCAAVSKWERCETLPDITLLPILAHYFNVSIDELMGYDAARIEDEINAFFKESRRLFRAGKKDECVRLSEKMYKEYPNDYRVMNCYMWDKAGDYADNDPAVILENKAEFMSICQRILDGCSDVYLRLDAINMQGKILHAEGRTEEAFALYEKEIPNWYLTSGQKTEQLFAKDTPEFARQLKLNMFELGAFAINKKCKEIWYCTDLSVDERGNAVIKFCHALESLRDIDFLGEIDYYIWYAARDIAHKMKYFGGNDDILKELRQIGEEAWSRFEKYCETDPVAYEYSKKNI